jgi:mono/diheme cytochrome c family protein
MVVLPLAALSLAMDTGADRRGPRAATPTAAKRNLAGPPVLAAVQGNYSTAAARAAKDHNFASTSANATAQDSLGKAVFTGKGNCHVCHGAEAKGGPLGPDLTDAEWLHIDGKAESIADLIKKGVPTPKQFPAPMLPMGGAQLTDAEVQAVARYIVSLGPKT